MIEARCRFNGKHYYNFPDIYDAADTLGIKIAVIRKVVEGKQKHCGRWLLTEVKTIKKETKQ